jgi:hypothetical protein
MIPHLAEAFTLKSYEQLLQIGLDAGYRFSSFSEPDEFPDGPTCLLRHDIDNELLHCDPMLSVERRLGVRATYFVMLRSSAYNLHCVEALEIIKRIIADGHWLGLHFMGERFENATADEIVSEVRREAAWLETEFGVPVRAVSFHQPSRSIIEGNLEITGLVNTYNRKQLAGYHYMSDSNMDWRGHDPYQALSGRQYWKLQLLIHPMWWTHHPLSLLEKWQSVLRMNTRATTEHWQAREATLRNASVTWQWGEPR